MALLEPWNGDLRKIRDNLEESPQQAARALGALDVRRERQEDTLSKHLRDATNPLDFSPVWKEKPIRVISAFCFDEFSKTGTGGGVDGFASVYLTLRERDGDVLSRNKRPSTSSGGIRETSSGPRSLSAISVSQVPAEFLAIPELRSLPGPPLRVRIQGEELRSAKIWSSRPASSLRRPSSAARPSSTSSLRWARPQAVRPAASSAGSPRAAEPVEGGLREHHMVKG
ncbi:hypothetical protein GGS23DRAFT_598152 [Durotheca rogersii]|uniref:uncharacterized protein n=1 Tax=Durotheca rogersii TaxID=419775 RepID=UPI00221FEA48|nr:uncharacterized protein GGS23DRAFT_598152 [Durotheca rogersii]KAI5861746.1 hypothetical protein GGS23DRAFT_598152 [Durotheca rogersii]